MSGMNLVLPIGQRSALSGHFDASAVLEDARPLGSDGAGGDEYQVRRIEVKSYARGTPIQLTANEWYKAKQLTEMYWLYIGWDPLGAPELACIQNPAVKLGHAKREVIASRFFEIPAEAINQHTSR
jgi:hypothetical protein